MKIIIFILLLYLKPTNNLSNNDLIVPINHLYENYTTYFMNLVKIYDQFHTIYHIDAQSKDMYDDLMKLLRKSKTIATYTAYNYDMLTEKFVRPSASRILHIIFTSEPLYWEVFSLPYMVTYRDVCVFISTNFTNESIYLKSNLVKLAGKVLLINIINSSSDGIQLYQMCYYCGNLSGSLMPVLGDPSNGTLLPYKYRNLNGHLLNLTYTANYPFVYCDEFKKDRFKNMSVNNCLQLSGIESHMVRLVAKKMNFKYKIYSARSNSSFLNMLNNIMAQKYDLAFGSISVTLSRRNIIQFTIAYNVEDYNLLYKVTLSFTDMLKKFFDPFSDLYCWGLFLSVQFLLVFLLVLLQKLEHRKRRKKNLIDCFWLLLQIQLEQSSSTVTSYSPSASRQLSSSTKMSKYSSSLILLWCLMCLVLCSAFKGVTLSTFLKPPKTDPQGLLELLDKGYGLAANDKSKDIIKELMYGLPYIPNVYFGQTNCEVFSLALTEKVGMINEWSILQFQLKKYCPRLDPAVNGVIRIARRPVRNAGHAWATQAGTPYRIALDYYLSLIQSGGLYVKWTRDHTYSIAKDARPFRLSRDNQKQMDVAQLPLRAFYPLFIVYMIGICFAVIIFICELIFHKTKYVKHNKK